MSSVLTNGFRCQVTGLLALLLVGPPAWAQHLDPHHARDLSRAEPEAVGLSASRLERLAAGMQQVVDDGGLSGVVTMVARNGRLAFADAVGVQDIESGQPMALNTLFRIWSMTKPVTGVALMMLYEEGKWQLNDPVSDYIPEFSDLRVYVGEQAAGSPATEPATRSMTMLELMTHSGGLDYGGADAVGQMYQEHGVPNPDAPLQTLIDDLSQLPLREQPGTSYHYSVSVDVQGYLVEKLSGQPFDEFLLTRIFEPLGMEDTGFFVPVGDVDRAARTYRATEDGLELTGDIRTLPPTGPMGGQGLYSTAGDYLRFAQMLLNGGALDGVQLLSPRTVQMMRTNHLADGPASTLPSTHVYGRGRGLGWGLGFEVVMDAAAAGEPTRDGTFYWLGAAGTWFWIDPASDLVFAGMIQHFGDAAREVYDKSRNSVYQALTR